MYVRILAYCLAHDSSLTMHIAQKTCEEDRAITVFRFSIKLTKKAPQF